MNKVEERLAVDKHKEIKKISTKFYAYAFGFLLTYSPYIAVIGLQSSVNIEGGLGTLSLGIAYGLSGLFSLLCTPILIRRFGCKWTLIGGEAMYLVYVAANYYPTPYTLFPAAMLVGIGEAALWTSLPMYNVYFGRSQAKFGSRVEDDYIRKYIGHFYAIFQFAQLFGSSISYAILYGSKNKLASNNSAFIFNETTSPQNLDSPYKFCGAKDCQDPNITKINLDRYVPTDAVSFYVLVTVYSILCTSGLLLHICMLPKSITGNKHECEEEILTRENEAYIYDVREKATDSKTQPSSKTTLVMTFKHVIHSRQALLLPITVYFGAFVAFLLSDLTRAYSSCVLGVEQVGLSLMVYAVISGSLSMAARRIIRYFGRTKVIAATCLLDALNFLFCLYWQPQKSNAYLIYAVFVVFGISDSSWNNTIMGTYSDYFPDNPEIAFSILSTCIAIGFSVGFITSSLICVSVKIYALIGLLAISAVLYGAAENLHRKMVKNQNTDS